jgi:hypothetical protein
VTYIYVASSWRNRYYPGVVAMLRAAGAQSGAEGPHYGVHDFRDPAGHFSWSDIDPDWKGWDPATFRDQLHHPSSDVGWERDKGGLDKATACLLVGPCGRSAHLELGYAVGRGLDTAIYLPEPQEPELMYRFASTILVDPTEVIKWAAGLSPIPMEES